MSLRLKLLSKFANERFGRFAIEFEIVRVRSSFLEFWRVRILENSWNLQSRTLSISVHAGFDEFKLLPMKDSASLRLSLKLLDRDRDSWNSGVSEFLKIRGIFNFCLRRRSSLRRSL